MEQQITKDMLRQIVNNAYTLPHGVDPFDFAWSIMPNLRSPDPELRDELTYTILCQLLIRNQLNEQQTADLLAHATNELHYGIGESGTDSVFARSFGVLIVAAIFIVDKKQPKLSISDLQNVTDKVIEYAYSERDYRGYDPVKGWAHSVAHTADALGACALHPFATQADQTRVLEAIRYLASLPTPLCFEEDDRLAYPVLRLLLRDEPNATDWRAWVMKFDACDSPSGEDTLRVVNSSRFLRSLYLLLQWEYPTCDLLPVLENQIKRLHGLYHY